MKYRNFLQTFFFAVLLVSFDGKPQTEERIAIDVEAFSAIKGFYLLNELALESGASGVDLPVKLPILGLQQSNNKSGRYKLESGSEFSDSISYDSVRGDWYSQTIEIDGATVLVEGELVRMSQVIDFGLTDTNLALIVNPEIQFLFADRNISTQDPIEVIASFNLGGGLYRVTIMCHHEGSPQCKNDKKIKKILLEIEILGRGDIF